jgi:hypothetical protein
VTLGSRCTSRREPSPHPIHQGDFVENTITLYRDTRDDCAIVDAGGEAEAHLRSIGYAEIPASERPGLAEPEPAPAPVPVPVPVPVADADESGSGGKRKRS